MNRVSSELYPPALPPRLLPLLLPLVLPSVLACSEAAVVAAAEGSGATVAAATTREDDTSRAPVVSMGRADQAVVLEILKRFAADDTVVASELTLSSSGGQVTVSRKDGAPVPERALALIAGTPGVVSIAGVAQPPRPAQVDFTTAFADEIAAATPSAANDVVAPAERRPASGGEEEEALGERVAEPAPAAAGSSTGNVAEGSGAPAARPRTYRVGPGDTLSSVAAKTLGNGNQWQRIYELNRAAIGPDPARLRLNMELRIPQN